MQRALEKFMQPIKKSETLLSKVEVESNLVKGCKDNDRRTQELVYKTYFPAISRMCRKYTTDEDELISIINDGFLKVYTKIGQFEGTGSFEGWIKRLVFTSLSDYFRKKNRGVKFIELGDFMGNQQEESNALSDLYFDDVVKNLSILPEGSKKIFIMYHMEGYSHADIAAKMNISEGTSKWHVHNARKILIENMKYNS